MFLSGTDPGAATASSSSYLAHILKPDAPADADASSSAPPPPRAQMVVLGGGSGEGRSGVPNKLVVAALKPDAATPDLYTEAALVVETKEKVPYRMVVHPHGDGVVCAFPNGCRVVNGNSSALCGEIVLLRHGTKLMRMAIWEKGE